MNQCQTCRHWTHEPDTDPYAAHALLTSIKRSDAERDAFFDLEYDAEWQAARELNTRIGECRAPRLHFFVPPAEGEAAIMDASSFRASLITTRTFGCTLWEGKDG